jgi:integrase
LYRDVGGWYVADYVDAEGKRRRRRVARTEREARSALAMLQGQALRDRLLNVRQPKPATFEEFADRFLDHVRSELKAWDRYRSSLRSLTPFFGNLALTAITPEMIDRFKRARVEPFSDPEKRRRRQATANRDLQCLRRMFNLAIAWGYARENPVRFVKFFKELTCRIRYLTREQYEALLRASPEDIRGLVVAAVHTGLRLGELLSLNWAHVDLENGFLSVDDPKNSAPAKVPLNAAAARVLQEIRTATRSVRVFVGLQGRPLAMRTVEKRFSRALCRAGIENFRFHDLRHTCASWLVMAGVELRKVRDILRHRDIRTTMRYAHLAPDHIKEAVKRLDEFARSQVSEIAPGA